MDWKFIIVAIILHLNSVQLGDDEFDYVNKEEEKNKYSVFRPVKSGQAPYFISMKRSNGAGPGKRYYHFCGASLISTNKVLTAAECMERRRNRFSIIYGFKRIKNIGLIRLVAGHLKYLGIQRKDTMLYGQWRKIARVAVDPNYQYPLHDVCIIVVKRKYNFNTNVKYMNVPSEYEELGGFRCIFMGFSTFVRDLDALSPVLMIGRMQLLNYTACRQEARRQHLNCGHAMNFMHPKDVGGPLICKETELEEERPGVGIQVAFASSLRYTWKIVFFTRTCTHKAFIMSSGAVATKNVSIFIYFAIFSITSLICIALWCFIFIYFSSLHAFVF